MMLTNCSTIKTNPYNVENTNKTLYYALPKTFLDITVEMELNEIKNAPFAEFGKCYGIISELKAPSNAFSIKSVTAETSSKLDVSKLYETKVINGFLNKTEFNNVYSSNGELTSSDYVTESQGLKYITSTVKFASSLFFGASVAGSSDIEDCLKKHVKEKDFEKVKKLVKRLEDLNGNLEYINTNAVDYSNPEVLKTQIKLINDEKKKIIGENFGYGTKTFEQKITFKVDPDLIGITEKEGVFTKSEDAKRILFKYDKENGILSSSSGDLNLQVWNRKKFESTEKENNRIVEVSIDLIVDNSYANSISKTDSDTSNSSASFFYRIPSINTLLVHQCFNETNGDDTTSKRKLIYVKNDIQLTQFGRVIGAPKNLAKVKFELYPKTAALKSISGNSAVVNIDHLDSLQSQILATKNLIKGQDDIDVEINDLKKEVELLELLKKKSDLENGVSDESEEVEESEN